MTYFVDENIAPGLVTILRACGLDASGVVERGWKGLLDEDLLPLVVDEGRVFITADANIRRRPNENRFFARNGLTALFVPSVIPGDRETQRMAWLLGVVDQIEEREAKVRHGDKLRAHGRGGVEAMRAPSTEWCKLIHLK